MSELAAQYSEGELEAHTEVCAPGGSEWKPIYEHSEVIRQLNPDGEAPRQQHLSFSDETVSLGEAESQALSRQTMGSNVDRHSEVTPLATVAHAASAVKDDFDSDEEATRVIDSVTDDADDTDEATRVLDSPLEEAEEATRIVETNPGKRVPAPAPADDEGDEATRVFQPDDDEGDATRVFDRSSPGNPQLPDAGSEARTSVGSVDPVPPVPPAAGAKRPAAPQASPPPTASSASQPGVAAPTPSAPQEPRFEQVPSEVTAARQSGYSGLYESRVSAPPSRTQNLLLGTFLFVVLCVGAAAALYLFERPTFDRGAARVREIVGMQARSSSTPQGPPFDTDAAGVVLERLAKRVDTCKTETGPTGKGRARVLYQPTGQAVSAAVSPPFHQTDVGTCLVELFTSEDVPPFGGDPVIVTKTFHLE